jgi:hypothetical protein
VLFSILYVILRGMLRLVPSAGGGREREVEILVLRHQVLMATSRCCASRPTVSRSSSFDDQGFSPMTLRPR